MPLTTLSGTTPAQVQHTGLIEFIQGVPFIGSVQTLDLRDLQQNTLQSQLPGVEVGTGIITAALLVVTIPAGLIYFARQRWIASGTTTVSVPDASTSYVWGCSDGILRLTSGTTPPTSFDVTTACLLTKAVATSGVATLDNTVQQQTRTANTATRKIADGGLLLDYAANLVDMRTAAGVLVPVLTSDPTSLTNGMVWIRSDLGQIAIRTGGTTVYVGASGTTLAHPLRKITANYTAVSGDEAIWIDATSGNVTLTLPASASGTVTFLDVKRLDSSANTVTIAAAGGETIDGASTLLLTTQYQSRVLRAGQGALAASWGVG